MSLFLFALLAVAIFMIALAVLSHRIFRVPQKPPETTPADLDLPATAVSVPTVRGKRLHGWWIPATPEAPVIVAIHGWGGSSAVMLPLMVPFHRAGYNLLLIDARNHGQSEKDSFASMPRFAEDVACAVQWLREQPDYRDSRVILMGHSVGGAAVLLAASRRSDISAVVTFGAFAHPGEITGRFLEIASVPRLLIPLMLHYIEWRIGHRWEEIAPVTTVCRIRCPVLLVHGTEDTTVPVENAHRIHQACPREDVELLLMEGVGHSPVEGMELHAGAILDFLERAGSGTQRGKKPAGQVL